MPPDTPNAAGEQARMAHMRHLVESLHHLESKLREGGSNEVAFRVMLKDGKVSFTARALKGDKK